MNPDVQAAIARVGKAVRYADGATIRPKGTFAPDFLLITEGAADCVLSETSGVTIRAGPGRVRWWERSGF